MATPTTLPASFTAGQILTAAQMNNLRGAFRILQVVEATYSTATSSSTNTFVDTGLTASITPSSTSSKILVFVSHGGVNKVAGNSLTAIDIQLLRTSTVIAECLAVLYTNSSTDLRTPSAVLVKLDSPATTSAVTYKTQFRSRNNTASVTVQGDSSTSTIILCEVSA